MPDNLDPEGGPSPSIPAEAEPLHTTASGVTVPDAEGPRPSGPGARAAPDPAAGTEGGEQGPPSVQVAPAAGPSPERRAALAALEKAGEGLRANLDGLVPAGVPFVATLVAVGYFHRRAKRALRALDALDVAEHRRIVVDVVVVEPPAPAENDADSSNAELFMNPSVADLSSPPLPPRDISRGTVVADPLPPLLPPAFDYGPN